MVTETWLRIGTWTCGAQRNGKPVVVSNLYPSWPVWQDRGDERGSKLFFNGLLENFYSKHGKRCFYGPTKIVEYWFGLLLEKIRSLRSAQAAAAVCLVLSNPFDLAHW